MSKLISGESYPLSKLFSGNERKIIIPDLQRDYCWGDKKYGENKNNELVTGFCESLFDAFRNHPEDELQLGMIYAYENPINHVQLCDGQQRLTTIFLLLGMLHRQTENSDIKECLIYKQEDQEPQLLYEIRETSLYFLSDLVCWFFSDEKTTNRDEKDIKEIITSKSWYYLEYDYDPTIQSMINAMVFIQKYISDKNNKNNLNDFANFLLDKVTFFYFDMKNRQHGEEMFVIINTTGAPLTPSENVKPILIGELNGTNQSYNEKWEEREKFFWQNRAENEYEADQGLKDFLKWYLQATQIKNEVNIVKAFQEDKYKENHLQKIQKYFEALEMLIKYMEDKAFSKICDNVSKIEESKISSKLHYLRRLTKTKSDHGVSQQQNIIVPLLAFMVKFPRDKEWHRQFLRRLRKNYFDKEPKRKERAQNYIDWRYILQIIEESDTEENVLKYKGQGKWIEIPNVKPPEENEWYNDEEKKKTKLKKDHQADIEEWEDHPDFMGDISPLLKVGGEDIVRLRSFYKTYCQINKKDFNYSENIEIKNRYLLYDLLYRGKWIPWRYITKSSKKCFYCMIEQNNDIVFHNDDDKKNDTFYDIWKKLESFKKNNENCIISFFKNEIEKFFNNIENKIFDFENDCGEEMDTRHIDHKKLIQLWLLLEFIYSNIYSKKKLIFSESINSDYSVACFYDYPNLVKIENENHLEKNNYQLGNLLLGTSYWGNKTGDFDFNQYPLMKELKNKSNDLSKEDIQEKTKLYSKWLKDELSQR